MTAKPLTDNVMWYYQDFLLAVASACRQSSEQSPAVNTTATRPITENMSTHLFLGKDDALSADSQNLKHFHMSFNLLGNASSMMQFVVLGVMHRDLNAVVRKTRRARFQYQHHVNFVSHWCCIQPISSRQPR